MAPRHTPLERYIITNALRQVYGVLEFVKTLEASSVSGLMLANVFDQYYTNPIKYLVYVHLYLRPL